MNYKESVRIRKATRQDVNSIYVLVDFYRFKADGSGFLLPLDITRIEKEIEHGNFFVADVSGYVAGCASVVEYDSIVELRSLAVNETYQRMGLGSKLIETCKDEASRRGYKQLYTLTQTPKLFEKYGFIKGEVPKEKLEKDCINCPLYHNSCVEIPLLARLSLKSNKR